MSTSVREQILVGLLARARTAYSIARRDVPQYNDNDLPRMILWEGAELNDTTQYGFDNLSLVVIIDFAIAVNPDTTVSTLANTILANIIDALQIDTDKTMSGLISSIRYRNSNVDYPEPGRGVLGVRVTFDVGYQIRRGNPYANN